MAPHQAQLVELPPELQLAIANLLSRPSDVQSLSLTCKPLNDVALKSLYHAVTLDLSGMDMKSLNGFFLADNPGHKYVKTIQFVPDHYESHDSKELDCVRNMISLAVSMVPENALKELRMPATLKVDTLFIFGLALRQRKLRVLECGGLPTSMAKTLNSPACPTNWLSSLAVLKIPEAASNIKALTSYQEVIRRAVNLSRLNITRPEGDLDNRGQRLLHDTADVPGQLATTLFSHLAPFGTKDPMLLSDIYLSGLQLGFADRTYLKIIDFTQLTSLTLWKCMGMCRFLRHFCTGLESQQSRLRRFICCYDHPLDVKTLTRILSQSPDLTILKLFFPGHEAANTKVWKKIKKECGGLKELVVMMYDDAAPLSSTSAAIPNNIASQVGKNFSDLQQLGVGAPTVCAEYSPDSLNEAYIKYILSISEASKLQALKILTWPLVPELLSEDVGDHDDDFLDCECVLCKLNALRYLAIIDGFATHLLRAIHQHRCSLDLPPLRLLSFGEPFSNCQVSDEANTMSITMEQVIYVPHWQTQLGSGPLQLVAARVSAKQLKYMGRAYQVTELT